MTGRQDREQRFDEELRRAARSLVTEELPRDILDPAFADARPRRALPGVAPIVAIAILLAATAIAISPGGIGPMRTPVPTPVPTGIRTPSPAPTASPVAPFRTTAAIRADFERLGWACRVGEPLSTIEPGANAVVRESAVCLPPDTTTEYMAAVIVGETAAGKVVDVHIKADIVGADTPAVRDTIAVAFAKAAAISSAIAATGNELATWVERTLPTLEPGDGRTTAIGGFGLKLIRQATGGYQLSVQPASP